MSKINIHHTTKTLSFFSLLLISVGIHISSGMEPKMKVYDYTASNSHKKINHHANFDNQESVNLNHHLQALNKNNEIMLTTTILSKEPSSRIDNYRGNQHNNNNNHKQFIKTCKKYLLYSGNLPIQKLVGAHSLGYHIVVTEPSHIVVNLLQWLGTSTEPYLHEVAFSGAICPKCYFLLSLIGYPLKNDKSIKVHEKGCQEKPFKWPMPRLAEKYMNNLIIRSENPLTVTYNILTKVAGISEESQNQLKSQLEKNKLLLDNKTHLLQETQCKLNKAHESFLEAQNNYKKLYAQLSQYEDNSNNKMNDDKPIIFKPKNNSQEKPMVNKLQYRAKTLPEDLSGKNLDDYDFTACAFNGTNLTDSTLNNVKLTHTSCNYLETFQNNTRKFGIPHSTYKDKLTNDFEQISLVYHSVDDVNKAKLLLIASALARLPLYKSTSFYIKALYWLSRLNMLKKELESKKEVDLRKQKFKLQLSCSAARMLERDAISCCWETKFPQDKITIKKKAQHANFDNYLADFKLSLMQYECESESMAGFQWYKINIIKTLEGLKQAYAKVENKQIQLAMIHIASDLSKSYQVGGYSLLHLYLSCQEKLVSIKESVKSEVKTHIYYNALESNLI